MSMQLHQASTTSIKVINIHAGHNPDGKVACGAVGLIKESTEARKVVANVITSLKRLGYEVNDCTVDNGLSQSDVLKKIVTKCNVKKVDLDISIHFNAGANDLNGNGLSTGTEVFVYSSSSKAVAYAKNVVDQISKLGFKNRGIKMSTALYFLKNVNAPAMLIECCFVDDKDDVAIYNASKMAEAIVKAIAATDGITYTAPTTSTSSNTTPNAATTFTGSSYKVQVGAFKEEQNAMYLVDKLKAAGFIAYITKN